MRKKKDGNEVKNNERTTDKMEGAEGITKLKINRRGGWLLNRNNAQNGKIKYFIKGKDSKVLHKQW